VVRAFPVGCARYRKRLKDGRKVAVYAFVYPMLVKEEAKRWSEMWRRRDWASLREAVQQIRGKMELDGQALRQWLCVDEPASGGRVIERSGCESASQLTYSSLVG
jgi:hypothetical protein